MFNPWVETPKKPVKTAPAAPARPAQRAVDWSQLQPAWRPPAATPQDAVARAAKSQAEAPQRAVQAPQARQAETRSGGLDAKIFKAEQAPAVEASAEVLDMLEAAGWLTPRTGQKKTGAMPEEAARGRVTPLRDHTYKLSAMEWERIQKAYGDAPGFTPPSLTEEAQAARDADAPSVSSTGNRAVQMSWADYEALSDDQRAAVDFNTLLVQARQKDLRSDYKDVDESKRKTYDDTVREMFGAEGGSDTYAPETVALLKQINFKAVGQDLDEYLSLDRAVAADELDSFEIDPKKIEQLLVKEPKTGYVHGAGVQTLEPASNNYAQVRAEDNLIRLDSAVVAANKARLEEVMRNAQTALYDFRNAAAVAGNDLVTSLGGTANDRGMVPWGFGMPSDRASENDVKKDEFFRTRYAEMIGGRPLDDLLADLATRQFTPGEVQELFRYFDEQSARDITYPSQPGEGLQGQRTPQELRTMLKLDGG